MRKLILALAITLSTATLAYCPIAPSSQIIGYIEAACLILNMDTEKVLVRAFDESSFRNVIVYEKRTKHYSYGALQISLATARIRHPKITAKQLRDPWNNIYCAVEHMRDIEADFCGNWQQVISVYMTGYPDRKEKMYKYEKKKYEALKIYQERRKTHEKGINGFSITGCGDAGLC
jgi:hypothetical protein